MLVVREIGCGRRGRYVDDVSFHRYLPLNILIQLCSEQEPGAQQAEVDCMLLEGDFETTTRRRPLQRGEGG